MFDPLLDRTLDRKLNYQPGKPYRYSAIRARQQRKNAMSTNDTITYKVPVAQLDPIFGTAYPRLGLSEYLMHRTIGDLAHAEYGDQVHAKRDDKSYQFAYTSDAGPEEALQYNIKEWLDSFPHQSFWQRSSWFNRKLRLKAPTFDVFDVSERPIEEVFDFLREYSIRPNQYQFITNRVVRDGKLQITFADSEITVLFKLMFG